MLITRHRLLGHKEQLNWCDLVTTELVQPKTEFGGNARSLGSPPSCSLSAGPLLSAGSNSTG